MKTKLPILILTMLCCLPAISYGKENGSKTQSDDNNFKFEIYGFVRNDFTYDSRKTIASVGELFNFIPYDRDINGLGQDLNATPSTRLLAVTTRIGLNVTSPLYGKLRLSSKLEADFCGSGAQYMLLRIRQAYVALDWPHHRITAGQTWHPMTGELLPSIVSLNTGAPFNPFSRAPQLRYDAKAGGFTVSAAAIYQFQYTSPGPDGSSNKYQVFGGIPELYIGATYKNDNWKVGLGGEFMQIKPRTSGNIQIETEENSYQDMKISVDEHVNSFAGQLFISYTYRGFDIKAKSVLGQNLSHLLMMSGYGAYDYNAKNDTYRYTPLTQSATWLTIGYSTGNEIHKWKATLLGGYIKNLGAAENLIPGKVYLRGFDNIDQIFRVAPSVQYSFKNLNIGIEYEYTGVNYGSINPDYTVTGERIVSNHRAYLICTYTFSHLFAK